MKSILILLCFIFTSCGKLVDQAKNDSRFDSIKEQFEKDAAFFGIDVETENISIEFGDTRKKVKYAGVVPITKDPGPSYGYCLILGKTNNDFGKPLTKLAFGSRHNSRRIVISDEMKNLPIKDIEATVYHELGHCALDLGHNEKEQLMSTTFNGNMEHLRYFMLKEMFTHVRESPATLTRVVATKDEDVLIYEVDYHLLGERIYYQLYLNQRNGRYYYLNHP